MVDKCANPLCNKSFRYFRGGRLYAFTRRDRRIPDSLPRVEHFWLCELCATEMTLSLDVNGQAQVHRLHRAACAD